MNTLTIKSVSVAISSILLISCVGISGFIYPISDNDIKWSTKSLNETECPNLTGSYTNWDHLHNSLNNALTHYNHQAHEIPNVESYNYINEPDWNLSFEKRERTRKIFTTSESFLEIIQNGLDSIELKVTGLNKQVYNRKVFSIVKASRGYQVGCYQNKLIVREISHHGSEGAAKSVSATEIQYSRETDKSVKVITTYRSWTHHKEPSTRTNTEFFKPFEDN